MSSSDQRRASRFGVLTEHERATLRWKRSTYLVRLVDQSAGGFNVQLEGPIDIETGQTASFYWTGGGCEVRVANKSKENDFVRLGLERMRDLEAAGHREPWSSIWFRRPLVRLPPADWSYGIVGFLVIVGFGLIVTNAKIRPPRVPSSILQMPLLGGSKSFEPSVPQALVPQPSRNDTGAFSPVPKLDLPKKFMTGILPRTAGQSRAERVPRFDGPALSDRQSGQVDDNSLALALPMFINGLHVSEKQRRQLEALTMSTREAVKGVDRRRDEIGTKRAMEEIKSINRAASHKALSLLSAEQAEQLRALVASSRVRPTDNAGGGPKTSP
jgi:hypothetical protein